MSCNAHPRPCAALLSHPFVERLIGTVRRECLDRTLFWTAADLELKLIDFQSDYNGHRAHAGLDERTPQPSPDSVPRTRLCEFVSVAAALSRAVSDTDGSVTLRRRLMANANVGPCRLIETLPCAQCLSKALARLAGHVRSGGVGIRGPTLRQVFQAVCSTNWEFATNRYKWDREVRRSLRERLRRPGRATCEECSEMSQSLGLGLVLEIGAELVTQERRQSRLLVHEIVLLADILP
jgi:Integrase core domain